MPRTIRNDKNNTKLNTYSRGEDVLSAVFHGVGVLLSVIGSVVLLTLAMMYADGRALISCSIFSVSMIFLYSASTVYHAVKSEGRKKLFKKFDHIAIYYLIAGTYTPFMLVNLRGTLGWIMFSVIWGLAIFGTILKLTLPVNGTKKWSVALYLIMGWLIVIAFKPLIAAIPTVGLVYLIVGGFLYSLGVIFYMWKSKEYTHAVWHLFVLGGTIAHFLAVLYSCVLSGV